MTGRQKPLCCSPASSSGISIVVVGADIDAASNTGNDTLEELLPIPVVFPSSVDVCHHSSAQRKRAIGASACRESASGVSISEHRRQACPTPVCRRRCHQHSISCGTVADPSKHLFLCDESPLVP